MDNIQTFWDKQAKKYDNSERQFEQIFKKVVSKTKTYLTKNDTVLDFGCATGTKTLELAESSGFIYGIDISPEMINEALNKLKAKQNINNAGFASGSIFENEFSGKVFDKIISYGVLHLINDKEGVIQKIHEMLAPGGLFISTTACLKDKMKLKNRIEFLLYVIIKKLGIFPLHLNMFTTTDVEKLISDSKFEILESERIFNGITISFIVAQKK